MKHRLFTIDFVRTVAIIGVMVTHSLVPFLGKQSINSTWNYLHFVVVAFVFCSGYITVYSYPRSNTGRSLPAWCKKRFRRLYLPYLIYLFVYAVALFLFPAVVTGRDISLTTRFFLDSITLTGGSDVGWLTLLFLQLAVLTPILPGITRNNKRLTGSLIICGFFALITTFVRIPASYSRMIAWLPWSFIFLLGALAGQKEKHDGAKIQNYLIAGMVSFCVWIIFTALLNYLHKPLTLTLHKYPPDLYYFLYGIGITYTLFGLGKLWEKQGEHFTSAISFISRYSYGMFFTHLIILDAVTKTIHQGNVFTTIGISVASTLLLTWGGTILLRKFNTSQVPKS